VGVWYCTREDVKRALDSKETARNDAQIDRAIEGATSVVEGLCHRRFYPWTGTRVFDWPSRANQTPWRLWLNQYEVVSVTSLTSNATTIASGDYFLEPANSGPPFSRIELDRSSSASFGNSDTPQHDISVAGWWNWPATTQRAGSLAEALDSSETSVDLTDASAFGVGSILLVDSEYMLVTERAMLDTTQDTQAALDNSKAAVTVAVTTGSAFHVGEVLLIDSERMLIVDIAGNNLTVTRAWDGSVLAAHLSGASIYAARTATVTRGALGTTAAAHSDATAAYVHVVPAQVRSLAVAEAMNTLLQESAGYGRTVGSGDNQREAGGRGLKALREDVYTAYGRKARSRAV
jgi:hypothetical protein